MNKGKVTMDQLLNAFKDTDIFMQLKNPYSLVTKLLLSPFFKKLPLTHYDREDEVLMKDQYVLTDVNIKQFHMMIDDRKSPNLSPR